MSEASHQEDGKMRQDDLVRDGRESLGLMDELVGEKIIQKYRERDGSR